MISVRVMLRTLLLQKAAQPVADEPVVCPLQAGTTDRIVAPPPPPCHAVPPELGRLYRVEPMAHLSIIMPVARFCHTDTALVPKYDAAQLITIVRLYRLNMMLAW